MTCKVAIANILWKAHEAGGRLTPPFGERYVAISKFVSNSCTQEDERWDLAVDCSESGKNSVPLFWASVKVWFLAQNAPVSLLKKGLQFELFEGKKLVASGEIIESAKDA